MICKGASIGSGINNSFQRAGGRERDCRRGQRRDKRRAADAVVAGNPARIMRMMTLAEDKTAPIPFLDLVTPHVEMEQELVAAFQNCLRTACFVGGSPVQDFEKQFAEFCRTGHAVALNSGTDALRFALMACGVGPGDVVVTVPNTFIATTEAISQSGALPEFVDVDQRTANLSVASLETYLKTQCTRDRAGKLKSLRSGHPVTAIVPVHLYGQMADMDGILRLAEAYGLMVVEDACQAHGAEYFSRRRNAGCAPARWAVRPRSAFIPGKTWARWEKAEQSRRTMPRWRGKSRCCAITASPKSITTTSRDITGGSIRSRRVSGRQAAVLRRVECAAERACA